MMMGFPFVMLMFVFMVAFQCLTDEHRGKIGKYEGLNKCHHNFYEIDEYGKSNRQRRKAPACHRAH